MESDANIYNFIIIYIWFYIYVFRKSKSDGRNI